MDRKKINQQIKKHILVLKKVFNPEQIILYGSYARNEANDWSDVDLLMIADFKNLPFEKRLNKIDGTTIKIKSNLIFDIRGLTPKEFNSAKPWTIYEEIKKEGVVLYQR